MQQPPTVRAVIWGGHVRGTRGRDDTRFGLALLSLSRPAAAAEDPPLLPALIGCEIAVPPELAAALDAGLPSRAKNYIARTVGHMDVGHANPADAALVVDGQRLGPLVSNHLGHLEHAHAAAAAGFRPTCAVRMIRAPGRALRVMADLPMAPIGPTDSSGGLSFDLL